MNETEIQNVQSSIEEFVTDKYMTGYKLAKLTNEVLTHFELKNIPPQMVYNYISKKLIASVIIDGQKVVSNESAVTFLNKYVTKKLSK